MPDMPPPVFIGDEITATAYRLAGARTLVPERGGVREAFEGAIAGAELLLITAGCAAELPQERLALAIRAAAPLVLVVPDAASGIAPPALDREVDRVLGIDS